MKHICPFCEVGEMTRVAYTDTVKAGRRSVQVPGLLKLVCAECGEESVPAQVYDRNSKVVEEALAATSAAVSRGLLRRLRETWDVSQRDASRLFGAGESAFAKWESGQARMSEPSALLVQCALNVPGVMEYLASLAKIALSAQTHVHKFKIGVDHDWTFPKDLNVPTVKMAGLRLVSTNTMTHKVAALPGKERPTWKREYSWSADTERVAA